MRVWLEAWGYSVHTRVLLDAAPLLREERGMLERVHGEAKSECVRGWPDRQYGPFPPLPILYEGISVHANTYLQVKDGKWVGCLIMDNYHRRERSYARQTKEPYHDNQALEMGGIGGVR